MANSANPITEEEEGEEENKKEQEEDYWKRQYENLQRDLSQKEVENRVWEKKYAKLEEKCTKLESQLGASLELGSALGEVDKLNQIVKSREATISELEAINRDLKEQNYGLKIQLQTAQLNLNAQREQIEQFVNLQVSYQELSDEHARSQRKAQEDRQNLLQEMESLRP